MIRFNALGAPDLHGGAASDAGSALSQPRVLALLTYLAVARPRAFHRRDSLVALFWPELDHEGARNALRQLVHRLRRAIGEEVVVSRGADEIGLDPSRIECDVVAFEAALDAGRAAEALEQYRGDLLPGFFIADAPEFERWLDDERTRLRRRAATVAAQLAESESAAGKHTSAAQYARRARELAGDDETAVRRQIVILTRGGDRTGALKVYEAFERRLASEFELTPSAETRALVAEMQRAGPTSPVPKGHTPDVAIAAVGGLDVVTPAASSPEAPGGIRPRTAPARRRAVMPMLAALGVVTVLAILVSVSRLVSRERAETPPARSDVRTLAVLPFAMRGGDDLAYLSEGMADLLSAKLNGAVGFRAVDPHAVMAAIDGDSAGALGVVEGTRVARSVAAGWMITGQLVELAGRLQMSATLYELRGAPRVAATANVSGETTNLFQLVDDLTGRILAGIAVGRDTALIRLSAVTTHSLPALKAYLEGEQAFRAGHDARAYAAFNEAVSLDSTFALAQYRLAVTASWASTLGREGADRLAVRAAARADRLTPLLRDLIRAYRAYRDSRADEAERLYRAIVDAHPDNVEAWMMLGETLFHYNALRGRSSGEARSAFWRVLSLDPANPHAIIHLARQAALDGNAATLDSLAARYASLHSDAERLVEMRALSAYTRDDTTERAVIAMAARAAADVPFAGLTQAGLNYAEHPAAAVDLWPALRSPQRDRRLMSTLYMEFSDVDPARGRLSSGTLPPPLDAPAVRAWRLETEALLASEAMFAVPRGRVTELRRRIAATPRYPVLSSYAESPSAGAGAPMRQYLLGLLSLRLDDTTAARTAREVLLRDRTGPSASISAAFATALAVEELRRRGDATGALARLDSFPFEWRHVVDHGHFGLRERFVRGELLRALGRDVEAMEALNALTSAYDLPFIAVAHLRRAQIQERLGAHEAARFHYGRFLRWWGEADPERQPLVEEARRALESMGR